MTNSGANLVIHPIAKIMRGQRFTFAAYSSDGASIITHSANGCERWCAQTGNGLGLIDRGDDGFLTPSEFFKRNLPEEHPTTEAEVSAQKIFALPIRCYATAPNGSTAAVGSLDGSIGVVETSTGALSHLVGRQTVLNHMHPNSVASLQFDSSSTFMVSMAEEDDSPLLWDLLAPGKEKMFAGRPGKVLDKPLHLNEHTEPGIDTIEFSPNQARFVTTHRNVPSAMIWRVERV